jgi:hypothetical protein
MMQWVTTQTFPGILQLTRRKPLAANVTIGLRGPAEAAQAQHREKTQ